MGESLRVDSDLLRALAPELAELADMAYKELTQLKATLAAEGQCWGNDEPGRTFGESYEPDAEQGLAGYSNLIDNLRRTSAGVADAADAFHSEDQYIGNQLRDLDPVDVHPAWHDPIPVFDQPAWPGSDLSPESLPPNGTTPNNELGTGARDPDAAPPRSQQPQYQSNGDPDSPYQSRYPDYGPNTGTGMPDGPPIDRPPGTNASPTALNSASPGAAVPRSGTPERQAIAGKPSETPWSGPSSDTPWQRKASGTTPPPPGAGVSVPRNTPGGAPPGSVPPGSVPPGRVSPPQPARPAPAAAQPRKRTMSRRVAKAPRARPVPARAKQVQTDQAAMEAARTLAARHGLRIVGFETAGIAESTVHEIAAAIDDILGKYPFLALGGIEITELGGDAVSCVKWDRTAGWILLDRAVVASPTRIAEIVSAATRSGASVPGSEERPMYSVIVNDLGRIMEAAAGPAARQRAQMSLITEYRRISGPWDRTDTLAQILAGYRKWRGQLSGRCFSRNQFQAGAALAEAFTEVELRDDGACGPAKVLHHLVVENARGLSGTT